MTTSIATRYSLRIASSKDEIEENFADLHPPLSRSEALIEAERCYFCYDAPCTTACPTGIDIPAFIQKIRSDNIRGSARTIFSENIMGGMCARVCPTEVLCEEACVRNTHEEKPVEIGLLQRYATDPIIDARHASCSHARRPAASELPLSAAGRPGCPAHIASRCSAMMSWSSTATRSRAASTSTALRRTRPSTTSHRSRSSTSCRLAASRFATTVHWVKISS